MTVTPHPSLDFPSDVIALPGAITTLTVSPAESVRLLRMIAPDELALNIIATQLTIGRWAVLVRECPLAVLLDAQIFRTLRPLQPNEQVSLRLRSIALRTLPLKGIRILVESVPPRLEPKGSAA